MATIVIDHAVKNADSASCTHEHRSLANGATTSKDVAILPVTVNGVVISRRAIAAEVQNFPAHHPGDGWRAATRALVIRQLLLQEARRLDVPLEQQTDGDGRVETPDDALVRALIEREAPTPVADDETLRRFYENNRRRFVTSPLYEADHILIAARSDDCGAFATAREKAASIAAVLATEPDRFETLARDCSDCPSGAVGGNLGQIGAGDTTAEFEAVLAALTPREISSPVETRYGVHLIRLVRRIDSRPLPFEAVRARIEAYLNEHVRRQSIAQYIGLLIGKADIQGIALDGAASPLVQ